jgi:hypothetical protein
MTPDRGALEGLGRQELISEARRHGVRRPEVMTRVELVDEVLRLGTPNPVERKRVRGWLGVARDLVADIVEQGLNLPDAAALIRGDVRFEPLKPVQRPVATVTLAEIYGAQGHFQRALTMLHEVLEKEPEHEAARKLRDRLERERSAGAGARAPAAPAAAVFPEEPEPLTPRRLSKQPPAMSAVINDDTEPLTPRRLSKQPPPLAAVVHEGDAEPLTPRRLSKQPPPLAAVIDDDPEPLTPRRLSKRPPPAPELAPADDAVVLVRPGPSNAVVYYEVRSDRVNGNPLVMHVVEWRPTPHGAERVEHEFVVSGTRGTVAVSDLAPESVVRAAIGFKRFGRLKPFAVAVEAAFAPTGLTVVWAPRPRKDYGFACARAASAMPAT